MAIQAEPPLFGPLTKRDSCVFRLFAPAAREVILEIDGRPDEAMTHAGDGWHAREIAALPGTRYAFRVDGTRIPDPASRRQEGGVHGFSVVTDERYRWSTKAWKGRPFEETVFYETHAGLEGGYRKLAARLPALRDLGVTAIELMPVAAFPGARNWGYDGVLAFAPAESYGTPDDLKALVDRAHALGLMMVLDVVYNHFGPDGNYLHLTAPGFFRDDRTTPWGDAIDFRNDMVRRFFIENALYWTQDFRFDGLRLDAVHAIADKRFLLALSQEVRAAAAGRHIHLVLENDDNDASLLESAFSAQWNDDFHHAMHVLLTGETQGYYADHADKPAERLARVLAGGFDYQGAFSEHRKTNRGSPAGALPPTAFVSFLQNHDQTGNRGKGDRLTQLASEENLKAALALLLLSPQIPLLFMGEEVGSRAPFHYFTDHGPELARAVREGRAREFPGEAMSDPNAEETFQSSDPFRCAPDGERWRAFTRELLALRARTIVPRLKGARALGANAMGDRSVIARWRLGDGSRLTIAANFGDGPLALSSLDAGEPSHLIYGALAADGLPLSSTAAWLAPA